MGDEDTIMDKKLSVLLLSPPYVADHSLEESVYFGFRKVVGEREEYDFLFYARSVPQGGYERVREHLPKHAIIMVPTIVVRSPEQQTHVPLDLYRGSFKRDAELYIAIGEKNAWFECVRKTKESLFLRFQGVDYSLVERNALYARDPTIRPIIAGWKKCIDDVIDNPRHISECNTFVE